MSEANHNDDLIGKTLGQYTILEEIGRGGMATVYRARQQSIDRIVALKVLPRHFLHDPGFFERFEREVKVITELEHPHILPIYDYGETDGVPYIVMRYLAGGSMAQMVRRGVSSLDLIERPLSQVSQALDYAHNQGVIHRDLKPGNIMLDENGNAYLSDFGIARVMGSDLTGSAIIGTPAYMSPEQANGMPIDGRADIYALGVVLFELITGREPYQAETPMALLLKHINEPMPLARNFREDVPPLVEDVIAKATAKEPDDRYAAASDMAKAFSKALTASEDETRAPAPTAPMKQQPASAVPAPVSAPTPAPMPITDAGMHTTGPITMTTAGGRSSLALILALISVIAVVIIAVVVLLPNLNPPDESDNSDVPVAQMPTAFPRASSITTDPRYTVSIPDEWIPPQLFLDKSDDSRMLHQWQADDQSAYVSLALVDVGADASAADFDNAISSYHAEHYASNSALRQISEATAQDGTLRRSYRLEGEDWPYGQLDVFYQARGSNLAVVEMFTADATGNTLVPRLQLIYDSLRVEEALAAG